MSSTPNTFKLLCRLIMSESYETKDMKEVNGQIEIPSYATFLLPGQEDDLVARLFDLSLSGWHVYRIGSIRESWNYSILEVRLYRSDDVTTNIDAKLIERIMRLTRIGIERWRTST